MRKLFALAMGIFLLSMLSACSEDSTPTPPPPASDLEITTATVPTGYTCSPYSVAFEASGGKAPYTWSLVSGSSLPSGLTLGSDGRLRGLCMDTGNYTFTVRVEDSSETPKAVEQEYTLNVEVPANPSLALFYDEEASVCSTATTSWTTLDCYVFIMLEGSEVGCATAAEFKLQIVNADGVPLEEGTDFYFEGCEFPPYKALSIGNIFDGIAVAFYYPVYGYEPILVAKFQMLLLENLEDLAFKFEPNPGGGLRITSCESGYPMVDVTGRQAALNY